MSPHRIYFVFHFSLFVHIEIVAFSSSLVSRYALIGIYFLMLNGKLKSLPSQIFGVSLVHLVYVQQKH